MAKTETISSEEETATPALAQEMSTEQVQEFLGRSMKSKWTRHIQDLESKLDSLLSGDLPGVSYEASDKKEAERLCWVLRDWRRRKELTPKLYIKAEVNRVGVTRRVA